MNAEFLEWFGYIAMIVVAISMLMNSVLKFRWINLLGAVLFTSYGVFIEALPVAVLNGIIAVVDVYYLCKIYSKKETFQLLEVSHSDKYIFEFIKFHKNDILKFSSHFSYGVNEKDINFLILRDLSVAGVFIIRLHENKSIEVKLDYVLPAYRDMKNGKFIYRWILEKFSHEGYKTIWTQSDNKQQSEYLIKQGFTKKEKFYVKEI